MADYDVKLTGQQIDDAEGWAYTHRASNPSKTEADLVVETERAKTEEAAEKARAQAAEQTEKTRAQAAETQIATKIGNMSDLITENKTNLVAAINEAAASGGGGGGTGGPTTAAKVSFNNTGTGISSSNVQAALVEVDANVSDLLAKVFPLEAGYVSHNAGTYEKYTVVTPTAKMYARRKGADVTGSATFQTTPEANENQDFSWEGVSIKEGSVTYNTSVSQGGQTVMLSALTWNFTFYRYRGQISSVPAEITDAFIKSLATKELTTSTSLGSTTLGAGKYYLFAVKGTQANGDPLALVVKHAQTGGVISGCTLGVIELDMESDDRYANDYTYVIVPASTDAWNFTISL